MYKKTLVVDGITPVGAYQALRKRSEGGSFLLESVVGGERWGRYSILGYRPRSQHVVYGEPGVDPFTRLSQLAPGGGPDETDVAARFATACVGLLSYDLVHFVTKVEPWPELLGPKKRPIARMIADATVVVFDNLTHTAVIASQDPSEVERAERDLSLATALPLIAPPDPQALPSDVDVNMSDADYCRVVERAKEYIRAGDAFQIVPARTFSTPTGGADPFDVYRAMRVLSPAPYMYLLELPERDGASAVAIAGASPETLVRVEDKRITLRPIAGTRKRGRTPAEDQALAEEMMADPKERAEHVMLIDLARNDVGRVSKSGTVRVPLHMSVEKYSHVMHITSEVEGELAPHLGPWDVIRATFPAGTLSGAPKVRAMQIIRELELRPRGAYGGALGYVTRGTSLDLAIAIRTVVMQDGRFEVSAGAGIVADSVPQLEADETAQQGARRPLGDPSRALALSLPMQLSDENAFGVLIGYHAIEDDEYSLEPAAFAARFQEFRAAVRACVEAFPLAQSGLARELGHAVYIEFADGEQLEDPIGWIKTVRARLSALELPSVGVLSHGGRWQAEPPEAPHPSVCGIDWLPVSLPSEPLRRALYAETATHGADEEDESAWGPGIYVDTEAVEALGRTLKNAPTPLAVAGATFYRVAR